MAAVLELSGTATDTFGIMPAAPDGIIGWFEFASTQPTVAVANLRHRTAPAKIIGAPVFPGGFARFPGTAGNVIDTGIILEPSFGIIVLTRSTAMPPSGTAVAVSNFAGEGANQNQTYLSISGEFAVADCVVGYVGGRQNVQVAVPDFTQWKLLYMGATDGIEQRSINLTDNIISVQARATARMVETIPQRLGAHVNFGNSRGLDVAGIAFCNGRQPSIPEIVANAELMQRRAAAFGINVSLNTTA